MSDTLIVTGSGRSGTHWLAWVLSHFIDAYHEPSEIKGDVVVDCRQAHRLPRLTTKYRVVQLIRDGRDVCRSQFTAYSGRKPWEQVCKDWAGIVNACDDARLPVVRLEDLLERQDPSRKHIKPHHTLWTEEDAEVFWRHCGEIMVRHGYVEEAP